MVTADLESEFGCLRVKFNLVQEEASLEGLFICERNGMVDSFTDLAPYSHCLSIQVYNLNERRKKKLKR